MIKFFYIYTIFALSFFSCNVFPLDGYVKTSFSYADKDWNFLPSIPSSFDTSSNRELEFFILQNEYGLLINSSQFQLDVQRSSEPKNVNLTAMSNAFELFYLINPSTAFIFGMARQEADTQFIECYEFNSLIIGTCDNYDLKITNSKAEYDALGENLLMIDGEVNSINFSILKAVSNFAIDEFKFILTYNEHKFNWLTPLSEINSGFIYNLNLGGQTLGSSIDSTLSKLPQQKPWNSYNVKLEIFKEFQFNSHLKFFYDLSYLINRQEDYLNLIEIPKDNLKFKSGIKLLFEEFEASIHGSFYRNNLLGFEPIVLTQRTEHYFDQNFGLIGIDFKYNF
jgi:hypothetical protein